MQNQKPPEDEIFQVAYEISAPAARITYLKQVCRDAVEVERIIALLKEGSPEASFLENGPLGLDTDLTQELSAGVNLTGTMIGPYKLLQPIGEGGFGVVYMAEQTSPVRRKVALKVIKPGMDTKQVVARFEAERQALALMDHPNVARVFDGGSTDAGRPYFVMELVKGVPITEFCDENRLDVRQRLELFAIVCNAIQHAHHKGVIHRDIKPNNVLVTLHDGQPVPKVIDFGVSKAISQQLTEKTMFTAHGQMIGTAQYMSPEQAEISGLDIDTRSDIYSLGILLYELLTGGTPLDPKKIRETGYAEMQRIIREQESQKPSTRLSTLGDHLTIIASQRGTDPSRLGQFLRGDLDWIVMKAIEKERNRRYETASSFAADVKRYLQDEPVDACPPSLAYRFRKFARRNRGPVTAGALIALTLLLGTVGTTMGMFQARVEAKRSAQLADEATASEQREREERVKVQLKEKELQQQNYFHMVNLAQVALEKGRPAEALRRLEKCPVTLRHWEWNYMVRLAHSPREQSPTLRDLPGKVLACAWNPSDADEAVVVTDDGAVTALNVSATRISKRHLCKLVIGSHGASTVQNDNVNVWFSPQGDEVVVPLKQGGFAFVDVHTGDVTRSVCERASALTLAFHPDQNHQQFVTGGADGKARLWTYEGNPLPHAEMSHGDSGIHNIAYSADGSLIASGDTEGNLAVWSAKSGEQHFFIKAHGPPVNVLAFSHDGKLLATASFDHLVRLWDVSTGSMLREFRGHTSSIFGVSFCADDTRLASSCTNGSVRLWEVETGREILKLGKNMRRFGNVAFSPLGHRLLTASNADSVTVWDATPKSAATGPMIEFNPLGRVFAVEYARDGRHVISAGEDGVRIWDLVERKERRHVQKQMALDVALHPNQTQIAAVHPFDHKKQNVIGTLIWNTTDGSLADKIRWGDERGAREHDIRVAISPDGKWIAAGGSIGAQVRKLQDSMSEEASHRLGPPDAKVMAIEFSPCNRFVAVRTWEELRIYETSRLSTNHPGRKLATITSNSAWHIGFSPDGETLAFSDTGRLILVPTAEKSTQNRVSWQASTETVQCIQYSPDGQYIVIAGSDQTIRIWHVATQQLVHSFVEGSKVFDVAFGPDGNTLVSGSDTRVAVWDTSFLGQSKQSSHP